ncbi:MAG: MATE family multidrug resistance protein [Paracoccaceae bacterium]|jgi:MATE family multidrug resistance protein
MKSNPQIMPWSGHLKATLLLGLPIVGSHLAQMLITLTDTVMMGWYGIDELAAVVLASSIFFVLFIVGSGFAFAIMPMAASAEGEGDTKQVRRVVRMGLWISLIYCAIMMPLLWNFEAILLAIGQAPEIAKLAQTYMHVVQWSMFPAMLVMVLKSYLSALERVNLVLWVTILAAILNALVNYALIFGNWGFPEMGVRGAAIASILSTLLSFGFIALYVYLLPELKEYAIFTRFWRSDWPAFWEVFRLGWPIGATMLAETGLFSATAILMGWLGTTELATHGIAIQIASMAFVIYLGFSTAGTVRAGRALGRGDIAGIWRVAVTVLGLQLFVAALVIVMFLAIPETLIGAFLTDGSVEASDIVAYGVGLLLVTALFQIPDGVQVVALSLLRGIKDTKVPMILAVISYWVIGMPVAYILGFVWGYGGVGIWAGLVIGLTVAAVTMLWRFVWLMRKMNR